VPGEDRHRAEDQRQFAIRAVAELEHDTAGRGRLRLGDPAEAGAVERLALGLQHLEGEEHVVGGNRGAVGKLCALVDLEGELRALLVELDARGEQAIGGEGLVGRAHQQALLDVARHRIGRDAEHDERIQAVEGALLAKDDAPALGGLGSA
jgi:hypothetical protein